MQIFCKKSEKFLVIWHIFSNFALEIVNHALKMRKIKLYILLLLGVVSSCLFAQEMPKAPDLQTIDDGFFDPTRKEEKVREEYHFRVDYSLEVGYSQSNQRTKNNTYPDMFLHGARLGGLATFALPLHFGLQTGVIYTMRYGVNDQHWRSMDAQSAQVEVIKHRVLQHNLTIPIRAVYTIPLWKQLNMFFYGGPQLEFTLGETDFMKTKLSAPTQAWLESKGVHTNKYDRVWEGELIHTNIEMGIGGGMEWDRYRVQAGYDFGLNNRVKHSLLTDPKQHMWEWSWYTSFIYKF